MQTITPELEAILKSKFQAGASGFRARVEVGIVPVGQFLNASSAASKVWKVEDNGGVIGGTPSGWQDPGFDDTGWEDPDWTTTIGGVTAVPPSLQIYPHDAIAEVHLAGLDWLARIPFTLGSLPTVATMYWGYDDGADIYINGTLVLNDLGGTGNGYHNTTPHDVSSAPFVVGENVLAVRIHNWTGGIHWLGNPTWVEYRLFTDVNPSTIGLTGPKSVSIDKSLRMVADQASVEFSNEDLPFGWGPTNVIPTNTRLRIYQWFGDSANEILTFTGLVDRVQDHRDVLTTSVTARDMMAILIDQTFSATAPQTAGEAGAVRTPANGVYLAMEVSDILADILDRAGWPTADRAITPTSYVLDEFVIADGASLADTVIGETQLTGLVGYSAWADELGVFHFAPTGISQNLTEPVEAVYTFRSGEDLVSLDDETTQFDLRTRVKVRGPLTTQTLQDTWRELWRTTKFHRPVGLWHDPADAANLRVLDRGTKRLYKLRQSDRAVLSSINLGAAITYPLGISGDPADSTVYWVLNAPWIYTGSTSGNSVKKVRKSDNHVLATYSIPNGRWSALKVSSSFLWLTNLDTDRFYKRSKTDGSAIANYSHTYNSVVQANPSGVMVDGTTLYLFWANGGTTARFLVCDESAPGTITKVVKTAGTALHGGEMDTVTHTECYGDSDSLGLVAKFTLLQAVDQTDEVYAEVVNVELEDELGAFAELEPRTHDAHTGDPDHPFEIRRLTLDLTVITSLAQATETAQRQLDLASVRRRVVDAGIIGNPALQKTDPVAVIDPVTGLSDAFVIDTYRSQMSADGTYLGTLALLPVGPVDDDVTDEGDAT